MKPTRLVSLFMTSRSRTFMSQSVRDRLVTHVLEKVVSHSSQSAAVSKFMRTHVLTEYAQVTLATVCLVITHLLVLLKVSLVDSL